MHLFVHKGRHVVVSRTELPETGEVLVTHVTVAPTVSGAAKRGRKPAYDKVAVLVAVGELVKFTGELTAEVMTHAESQLAKIPEAATEATVD
jgi:mRNA-degrading endonuclease toxin of MazEF toxin-antitoxin module